MSDFKIAAAQVASIRGDVDRNIATHLRAVRTAAEHGISVIVFPELSLIGYEPASAGELAIDLDDERLAPLQTATRESRIEAVVGAPLRNAGGKPHLGAIVFAADGTRRTYSKMHLGGDEPNYFTPGGLPVTIQSHGQTVGLAICADSSQPSHPQAYAAAGATIYAAGVFLTDEWYATDSPRLAVYAARHRMLVVMANHAASIGTYRSVGKSTIWTPAGALLVQADGAATCLVIASYRDETWRGEIMDF